MPPTKAATVEFEHVTKVYGRTEKGTPGAVNDLSLSVPAGRICVLVGPSGCGKTTSLKMVNRLIEPTSGRILIDGIDAATREVTELRRGIGYVIQSTGLFPHLTIGDNVAVVPRLLGWDKARQRERTDELLGLVGLDPARYRDRYPSQLSGGERQRVGVARALAADPPLMLMDEPFGAVDPIVRERLQNEFLRLQEELAKTILFVTHDIDEAIKMGDLVAVMQTGGKLAQFGPPAEILANPASDFVARFVGADRGLKRLSLVRVGDLPPSPAVTARSGDDAAEARRRLVAASSPYLLVVDEDDRPVGWVDEAHLPATGSIAPDLASPMSPLLGPRTTLKDALSMLLDAGVQAGILVDGDGRVVGLIGLDAIIAELRAPVGREEAAVGAGAPA
jgi:osmoprotectant transport system ATP-binding protein